MQADTEFVTLLAAIRAGSCSRAQLDDLQRRCGRELDISDGILPTRVLVMARTAVLPMRYLSLPVVWATLSLTQNRLGSEPFRAHFCHNVRLTGTSHTADPWVSSSCSSYASPPLSRSLCVPACRLVLSLTAADQTERAILQLFSHREDVDAVNAAQLAALPGDAVRFAAQDDGRSPDVLQAACPVRRSGFRARL